MKKIKNKKISKKNLLAFIICAVTFSVIGASASTLLYSKDVTYDNSSSGLSSTTVQDALDELYEQSKTGGASVICDDSGNCTVTCKQGDPTITDSGYSCTTSTSVTCPSGTIYEATSTGYKCVQTVEPTITSTSASQYITSANETLVYCSYTNSDICYESSTDCTHRWKRCNKSISYSCSSGTLNGDKCYGDYYCPNGYKSSGSGSSMTCTKYTCPDGYTFNTSDHLCYLN